MAPVDDKPVWSIVCFVVSRKARKQGVAHALLEAAMDYAREHGATLLEAYPVETEGQRVPAAHAYKGTMGMFERAGFEVVDAPASHPDEHAAADRPPQGPAEASAGQVASVEARQVARRVCVERVRAHSQLEGPGLLHRR